MDLLTVIALGLFLGLRHATDPDHVIAMTTIVARERSAVGAAATGAVWGLGHTFALLVVGGGIIAFGWVIPPHIGLSLELSVGVVLIVLGVMNLVGAAGSLRDSLTSVTHSAGQEHGNVEHAHAHSHAHAHGDYVHTHPHTHDPDTHPHAAAETPLGKLDRRFAGWRSYRLARPLVVGLVHGLAGSAAIALLILTMIRDPLWGVVYLLVFGLGTIGGMVLLTLVIVLPFARTQDRFSIWNRRLRLASGVISVAFGLFVAYQATVVSGLFTGHPVWRPK